MTVLCTFISDSSTAAAGICTTDDPLISLRELKFKFKVSFICIGESSITISSLSLSKLHQSNVKMRIPEKVLSNLAIVYYLHFHSRSDENILNWIRRHYFFVILNVSEFLSIFLTKEGLNKYIKLFCKMKL